MESRVNQVKAYQFRPEATNRPLGIASDFHDDPLMRSTLRKSHNLQHPEALARAHPLHQNSPHTSYNYAGESTSIANPYLRSNNAYGAVGGSSLLGSTASAAGSTTHSNDCCVLGATNKDREVVLRFLGYFRERIFESNLETYRVRKVGLVFHVADGSLAIREARQPNSGIVQGMILSRQRVPRANDPSDTFTVDDFNIGQSVTVYGTTYYIVDLDESTRRYLRSVGKQVPDAAAPWPSHEDKYNAAVTRQFAVNPVKKMTTTDMDQKRVSEQLLTGIITKHSLDEIATAQQFHANKINEHLQFAAIWDDRNKISGDLRKCVIRYFLENDTVEIIEDRKENCGREGGAKLLVRQRIAVDGVDPLEAKAQQNTYGVILKKDFVQAKDFAVGATFRIHNVTYFIYDADTFTRRFFQDKLGVRLGEKVDISEIERRGYVEPPRHVPPPHDGLGTEEDSLQNWKYLMLKAPKQDPVKAEREEGKVLTFSAKLNGAVAPEDVGREFVIKFYRATDEVEVFERQGLNTGIVGGKFLAKGRHLKVLSSGRQIPFVPEDFQVGHPVLICSREFLLTDIDQRSQRIVQGIPTPVTEDRIRELVLIFKNILNTKFIRLHEAYRVVAPEGALTINEIRETFAKSVCTVTEEEAMYLVNYFAPDGNGVVSYERFVALMDVPNSQNMDVTSMHPRSVTGITMKLDESVKSATMDARDVNLTKRLRRMLVDKIVKRRGTLQESFLLLGGHSATAKLGKDSFILAMKDILHMNVTPREQEIVLGLVFANGVRELSFKQFHEFIELDD